MHFSKKMVGQLAIIRAFSGCHKIANRRSFINAPKRITEKTEFSTSKLQSEKTICPSFFLICQPTSISLENEKAASNSLKKHAKSRFCFWYDSNHIFYNFPKNCAFSILPTCVSVNLRCLLVKRRSRRRNRRHAWHINISRTQRFRQTCRRPPSSSPGQSKECSSSFHL